MIKQINQLAIEKETKTLIIGLSNESKLDSKLQNIVQILKKKKPSLYNFGEVTKFYPLDNFMSKQIIFVGLDSNQNDERKNVQVIFSKVYKHLREDSVIIFDTFKTLHKDNDVLAELISETITLIQYEFESYHTNKKEKINSKTYIYAKHGLEKAISYGVINGEATNHARTLVNQPRNKMTPTLLAEYAKKLAEELKIDYKIYDKDEIEKLGMGAFLAVNQGSKEGAKLIHLQYRNGGDAPITTLIGKGVTYDSGGYSIKPKDGMPGMKGDMGGSATVLGAIEAIARKELTANIDVVIAATDNLISNEAFVPDDVVVTMSGKTIEILNTDAEGRLTLVDAVTFAKENKASQIIDVATLTGGVITALGFEITGGFTNNNDLFDKIKSCAKLTGEDLWQLPVDQFRDRCKKSDVADYNNSPGRDGHASFAAAIIAEFVGDTPWVHLDIAGTSYSKADHILGPKGATGAMVRTITKFFE